MLVGAKGIGKTSSLKAFVQLCPRVVPNLFTIYVNYNNVITSGQEFRLSLISIVILRLRLLGVPIPEWREQEKSPKDNLLGFLLLNKLKVLILVDELDQLYKNCDDVSLHTLHDLAALGNQPTGTISVLVCGSSAMMEALITCNADMNVRMEFPLLNKGAPNLNETKYLTKRVYTTLPTDLDAVASMTGTETSVANKPWLRFVAFAGAAQRALLVVSSLITVYLARFCEVCPLMRRSAVITPWPPATCATSLRTSWRKYTRRTRI